MQKKLIALAVAGLASTGAFAQANVTVYGVADATFDVVKAAGDAKNELGNTTRVSSNSSYIGFKGAEALGAQAMAYSKKAVEDHVAAAKSLSGAKSVQEVIELQTTYAKSALDAYIAEVSKMSDIVSSSVKDAVKPLNERVTAAVERLQAAR